MNFIMSGSGSVSGSAFYFACINPDTDPDSDPDSNSDP